MSGYQEQPPFALAQLMEQATLSEAPSNDAPNRRGSQNNQQHGYHHQNGPQNYAHGQPQAPRYPPRNQQFNAYPRPSESLPLTAFMKAGHAVPAAFGTSPSAPPNIPTHQITSSGSRGQFHQHGRFPQRQHPNSLMQNDSRPFSQHQGHNWPNHKFKAAQDAHLELLLRQELPKVIANENEIRDKYSFLATIESSTYVDFARLFQSHSKFNLVPYGSIESGFATKGSDVDTVVVWDPSRPSPTPEEEASLPRLLEESILRNNWGARLLAHTRVPVLKVCARPTEELLEALRDERRKWETAKIEGAENPEITAAAQDGEAGTQPGIDMAPQTSQAEIVSPQNPDTDQPAVAESEDITKDANSTQKPAPVRRWRRERPASPLDYPLNSGPLIDINFSSTLGMINTKLLRCYSICDVRVVEMVHFVKSWAKHNRIGSAYNGSLCSYGWVLMVLHYLINIARPPVLPNLQNDYPHVPLVINDEDVGFFDNPAELARMRDNGMLFGGAPLNTQSTASLLRSFFHYYAHQGSRVASGGFRWRDDVISLRHPGGLVSKSSMGWTTSAVSEVNGVEVKQRYLLAIECPIEVRHNVARTVVHYGIVGIRDELRRAWNVLEEVGYGYPPDSGKDLFDYQGDGEEQDVKGTTEGDAKS